MPVWPQRCRFLLFPLVLKLDSVIAQRIFKISWTVLAPGLMTPSSSVGALLLCASDVIIVYGVCDVHQGCLMLEYLRISCRCCGDDFLCQCVAVMTIAWKPHSQVIYHHYYYELPVWVVATYDFHKIGSCCLLCLHVGVLSGVWAVTPWQGVLRSMPSLLAR